MATYNFYYSPTGGTKKVADLLSEEWGDEIIQVDLMKKAMPESVMSVSSGDLCIFSLPSYGGRIPEGTGERLAALSGNGAYAVMVAVYGNRAIDDTLVEMYDILTEAGYKCIAGIEAVAEHSLMRQYGKGRPDKQDGEELKTFAKEIKDAVVNGKVTACPEIPGNRPYRTFGGVPFKPVATSKCVRCGVCAEECPAGAIPLSDPKKTDNEKCISCMHCVTVCPVNARKLNSLVMFVAGNKMKKVCSGRKNNRLYL